MTVPKRRRIGCVYRPQHAPEHLANFARTAEAVGVEELWLWEDCFLQGGLTAAAIALSNTSTLTVGVGALPAPMRNVATTAMETATLARVFPRRLHLGVGHGVQDWMGHIGARVESPMTLLREYLTCLRLLLDGEHVTFKGRYVTLSDVTLQWPPTTHVELLCAATGPRTLQLSGQLADGTILSSGSSPQDVLNAAVLIDRGRARTPRPGDHRLITYLICTSGEHAERTAIREKAQWGFSDDADVAVFGDANRIASDMHRWFRAGADTIVLQPPAHANPQEFLTFIGSEIQPLLDHT